MNYLDSFNPETAAEALRILARTGRQTRLAIVMCRGVPTWKDAIIDVVERFAEAERPNEALLEKVEVMAAESPHGWAKILAQVALTGDPQGSLLVQLYERVFMAAKAAGARPSNPVDYVRHLSDIVLGDKAAKSRLTKADVEAMTSEAKAKHREQQKELTAEREQLEEERAKLERERAELEQERAELAKAKADTAKDEAAEPATAADPKPKKAKAK